MKKRFELPSIFFVYLLTVPTNVMCLGAFTEVWLANFQISRYQLAGLYLLSTVVVFFAMTFFRYVGSTKKAFLFLSVVALLLVLLPANSAVLFLFFFFTQWLGQGCLVGQCRCRLFKVVRPSRYGCVVGCLEAVGTFAVFLCPFLLLFLIQRWSWQATLCLLSLLYVLAAFLVKIPQTASVAISRVVHKDVKFWLANFVIYLPVILISGLFFHLEGICKAYDIPLQAWEHVSQIQAPGIIVGQIFFGYFWCKRFGIVALFFVMLVASQVAWVLNLTHFNGMLCVACGIIGWSLFGVLVNAFWSYLYRKHPSCIDESINASVGFGFLANAIGPILLCALF